MNKNYRLYKDSDLSEAQVEADVASYLGYITPYWSKRFRLKAIDEQLTGADKLFDRFVPIYLQFKTSEGLKPLGNNFTLSSPNRSLQKIRDFRRTNNINADPTLYFRLRDKASTATDFQHNILKSLHMPPKQFAMYVAPLTLSIDDYNKLLNTSFIDRILTIDPFFYRDEVMFTQTSKLPIGLIPFLRGHVSIPPHENVTTSEHYYSYSKSGGNIAWHSGENIKGDYRLSTQIKEILEVAYNDNNAGVSKELFLNFINEFNGFNMKRNKSSPDRTILDFAYFLKHEHNIKLMILERIER